MSIFSNIKKSEKLNYVKHKSGLEIWSFKMRDFFKVSTNLFNKDIFTYLEEKPNFKKFSIIKYEKFN